MRGFDYWRKRGFKHRINIDFETRSRVNIKDCGMYRYFADKMFRILLLGYRIDDGPVELLIIKDGVLPAWFTNILLDPTYLKTAYNAPFEIGAIERATGFKMVLQQWQCTKIMAAMAGYPMSLSETAKAMRLETLKDTRGTQLISLFCTPAKPTAKNGFKEWNEPDYFPKEWIEFCEYCRQDVVVEVAILDHPTVADMPDMPEEERHFWYVDQLINNRGVLMDMDLVHAAIEMYDTHTTSLISEFTSITGLTKVNSIPQVRGWLSSRGLVLPNLTKETVIEALKIPDLPKDVKRVLQIRAETGKTSMSKYFAMINGCCEWDNRIRGMMQHYGANRTGRVAGRQVNLLNLPKNKMKKDRMAKSRALAKEKLAKAIILLFGRLPFVLSELIRTVFIPKPGYKLGVSDFASIESRVGGWLVGAEWKLQAFREGKDIYLVTASNMYGLTYEELDLPKEQGKHPLREYAKVGELLGQYGGGANALIQGGATKSGQLKEKDLEAIVKKYRKSNPETVEAWEELDTAAKEAILDPGAIVPALNGKVRFMMQHGNLLCKLPSGRSLSYVNAKIKTVRRENPFYNPEKLLEWCEKHLDIKVPGYIWTDEEYDVKEFVRWVKKTYNEEVPWFVQVKYTQKVRDSEAILYEGMQDMGKGQRRWGIADTWGGKILENIDQAVSRDIMYNALLNLYYAGYDTVLHVYDESVNEILESDSIEDINRIMEMPVPWAPEIPLKAEGFETYFYMKE